MNLEQGIHSLNLAGLNIFLSTNVSNIPEEIYLFSNEQKNKNLVLIGNGGRLLWNNISDLSIENPIDNFSVNQMNWFAENFLNNDIEILFPDEKNLIPLQKLGRFFNLSHQSPLGMDISQEFGLWFAFRGVFLTNSHIPSAILSPSLSPCETCLKKLCMTVPDFFDARMKCPIKTQHQYTPEQRKYHQSVVLKIKK